MRTDEVKTVLLDEVGPAQRPRLVDALGALQLAPEQERFCLPPDLVLRKGEDNPARHTFAILVEQRACAEAVVVGIGALHPGAASPAVCREPHVLLRGFVVDARWQGRGVGTAATRAAVELARSRFPTAAALVLTVHIDNAAGQRAYGKCGFEPTGQRVHGRSGPELVMLARLR
ncbi:GNAT family N-acetyltransferase [Salinifilum ghardaiensis]